MFLDGRILPVAELLLRHAATRGQQIAFSDPRRTLSYAGNRGQASYGAANPFLDALAAVPGMPPGEEWRVLAAGRPQHGDPRQSPGTAR